MNFLDPEPVELLARRHDYFPASFRWHGRRFDVAAVEQCWTLKGSPLRRVFRVRCQAGRFELEQRVAGDVWRVRRWPLAFWLPRLARRGRPRFPLPKSQRRPQATPGVLARLAARLDYRRPARSIPQNQRTSPQWKPTPQRP
jgi:hypothetical protein